MAEKPNPINWKDVAMVVFDGEHPIIITSVEPRILFDTFQSLIEDDEQEFKNECLFDELDKSAEILKKIESFRWELYTIEQAKEIFCEAMKA